MNVVTLLNKARLGFFRNQNLLFVNLRQIRSNAISIFLILLLASCGALLTSCGGGGGGGGGSSSGKTLLAIAISPATQTVPTGVFAQYTATGTYSDGSTQNLTNQVTWGTESAVNVSIGASGLAVGTANNSAVITASFN